MRKEEGRMGKDNIKINIIEGGKDEEGGGKNEEG